MPEYEVEVEIILKIVVEDVKATDEEDAHQKASKYVREKYEQKIKGEQLTQIDTVSAVWSSEYEY